jgi:Tfp pilus assembly protein PilF
MHARRRQGRRAAALRPGQGWLDAGNPVRAATHLGRCVVLDPQYSAAWKLLGKAWLASGQPQAAREAWQRGLSVAGSKGDQQAQGNAGVPATPGPRTGGPGESGLS